MTAYIGTQLIDGWAQFWKHEISDEQLKEMIEFALKCPEATLHRWSIMIGPRPWLPDDSVISILEKEPRYSDCDIWSRRHQSNKPEA
jgi:hypothetical protein